MSNEDNPFFLMGAMLGEKSGEVTDLRRRIEELEAKLAQKDDLVQAAVAAALREAAQVARASFDGELGYDEILDLIPEGAQAALDRVVAAERENGFWVGRSCGGSKAEIDAALAAIRKGVKND
jgi:cell division septum initiation protein DivIVA